MRALLVVSPVLLLALGGCMRAGPAPSQWSAATTIGTPQDCIETSRIAETQVRSNQIVDFRLRGGMTYRNTLPNECPNLTLNRSFSYRSNANQLCSIDTIRVNLPGGGIPGPTCGLGEFQQIDLPVG